MKCLVGLIFYRFHLHPTHIFENIIWRLIQLVVFELVFICTGAWSLTIWLVSFQVWDNLIWSAKFWFVWDFVKGLFQSKLREDQQILTRALVLSVPFVLLSSKSNSLSAGFSFASPGYTIGLIFFCVQSSWF